MRLLAVLIGLIAVVGVGMDEAHAQSSEVGEYAIYRSDGTPATMDDLVAMLNTVDVIFIGETHDDPTAHVLQDSLLRRAEAEAREANRPLALSLEMFERDVQPIVDEYLAGTITERHFVDDARAWSNYRTDYHPLVERARSGDHPVLAANAPRRYVNRVAQRGRSALDSLSSWALQWLAPLPYPGPSDAYQQKWLDLMRASMPADHGAAAPDSVKASPHGHPHAMSGPSPMLQAQALWDATMAHTIARHLLRAPASLVVHITGGFHVSRGTGTPEALQHYRPSARSLVVMIEPADDPSSFDAEEHGELGDFVILTEAAKVPSRSQKR
ncbi:hypothetical protein CRI94_13490 [Longibacter salinarum]|uniref:Haem-binding uptake Tiki superfamily ChaN domain-containing protein n=1 Tax=Longibacter salinarum TaxID=1850348 RepID=A0A2A8CUZ6_9BACT|nr:ChaN family lipoprotein [Longibacter salinarum]PEN12535.1 hypothetical protein CRI94_13490 [Longibacter salinarum]